MVKTLEGFNRNVKVNFKIISSDPLIKLKKYDGASTHLGACIDQNAMPVTGLTEDYTEKNSKNTLVKRKGTRRAMEEELDLQEGELKQNSKYWYTFGINVTAERKTWNLENPYDLLNYLFAVAQVSVANGLKEIQTNSKAEYVIYSEEQEAGVKVVKRNYLKKAYALSSKLDANTKIQILSLYGYIADATNPNSIENKLDECIEESPKKFLDIAEDQYLVFRSLVKKALSSGVLSISNGSILHGEVPIGIDEIEASKALAANDKLVVIIKAKLSGDMDVLKESLKEETKEIKE